jgi:hypothetical protein
MSVALKAVSVVDAPPQPPKLKDLVVFGERAVSAPGHEWRLAGARVEAYLAALGVEPAARPALVGTVLRTAAESPAWATAGRAAAEAMRCLGEMLAGRYWTALGCETTELSPAEAAAAWRVLVWLKGLPQDILRRRFSITGPPFRIDGQGRARLSSMPPMRRAPMAPKQPRYFSLRWLRKLLAGGK